MTLRQVPVGETHRVLCVAVDDEEMRAFLLSLGCYEGELVTVISRRHGGCVIAVKDGRYVIDNPLAEALSVE